MEEPDGLSESDTPFSLHSKLPVPYHQTAVKRPQGFKRPYIEMVDSDDEEQPDLGVYFDKWNMSDRDIIVMCRSFASYLDRKGKAVKK